MRLSGLLSVSAMLALAPGAALAEDWRAVSTSHQDVVFVDADSVRRSFDGRIAFRALHRLAENESNRDFGYDRIDLTVAARCQERAPDLAPASSVRKYFLRGKAVAAVSWRDEEVVEDSARLAEMVCRGLVGHRSLGDLDRAMAEYKEHDSLERLAASISDEIEMTGIVVQGWEMNAVSLCGPDECRDQPPKEFCWLEGGINVPAPAGAPEWVDGGPRRDSAGAVFTGRVHRSRSRNGFGHMGGFACLVEVTGPARFAEVRRPPRVDHDAPGRRPEAVEAHAALVEAIKAAPTAELALNGKSWTFDGLDPSQSGGACYSTPRFRGADLDFAASSFGWGGAKAITRTGAAVTIVTDRYDSDLDLQLAHERAAADMAAFVRRLAGRGAAAVAQKGARVTVRFGRGAKEAFRFSDSAEAVRAAGIAEQLLGFDVAEVKQAGAGLTILGVQRKTLTFPDEAKAVQAMRRMEALRDACRPDRE